MLDMTELLPFKKQKQEINEEEKEKEECWWDVYNEEILPRLPADRLQTFKSVCRNWNHIISNPCFIRLHHNMYNQTQIRVLMPHDYRTMKEYKYKINTKQQTELEIPYPPAICGQICQILGCCDGLLCFLLRHVIATVAVYNPSTGKYHKVQLSPPFKKDISCSWFGSHPCCGEYLLVLVIRLSFCHSSHQVRVYKLTGLSSQCKCNLQLPAPAVVYRREERGVLLHGAVHWPARWINRFPGHVICSYHLDDKKYVMIAPPVQCDFKLGVVKGCLFAILKRVNAGFEMWIMKEYGVEQSWIKYADIEGLNYGKMLSPLGFLPNGELILDVDQCKLIKYNFNDNKSEPLMHHNNYDRCKAEAIMCDDSLVSPTMF